MKPEQDPERAPSREGAATKGPVTPGRTEPGEAAMKGRVTPVPPERSPDDLAHEGDGGTGEVSRREALKGRAEPPSTAPGPDKDGAPDKDGGFERNGDGRADRPAGTGTTGRGAAGRDARGDGEDRTPGGRPASRTKGSPDLPAPPPVPRDGGSGPADGGEHDRDGGTGRDERMLPLDLQDKFSLRMRHAVGGFIDGPQASVEEADQVLEELAGRFTEAVTRRRRDLRTSWQSGEAAESDTERLRLALRDYREMTERLLRI